MKILQEKGLVQVRQGSGTIVTPPSMWDMLDELVLAATIAEDDSLTILDDLVATRRVLESDMANVAARLADQDPSTGSAPWWTGWTNSSMTRPPTTNTTGRSTT